MQAVRPKSQAATGRVRMNSLKMRKFFESAYMPLKTTVLVIQMMRKTLRMSVRKAHFFRYDEMDVSP